jgi:hypothetical protein
VEKYEKPKEPKKQKEVKAPTPAVAPTRIQPKRAKKAN